MTRDDFLNHYHKWLPGQGFADDLDALLAAERAKERERCMSHLAKWQSICGGREAQEIIGYCIAAIRALKDEAP